MVDGLRFDLGYEFVDLGVADVDFDEFGGWVEVVGRGCFEAIDHVDFVALCQEFVDQMAADESCAPGHQNGAGLTM